MLAETAPTDTAGPGLWTRTHLPFAVGAVALVTLGAFENRAVSTVLSTVARSLDGLWLFGGASGAPLVTFVVATTVDGLWADRRSPVRVLYAGMALFVAGEALMGLAPDMVAFVVGRLVGGLAEGMLDVGLTVLVARALPPRLRPRIFAAFAAAWVLPSLLGPSVAGLVAERVHWRAVFLLGIVLLVPAWACLRRAMRATTPAETAATASSGSGAARQARWAAVAATGLGGLTFAGSMVAERGPERGWGVGLLAASVVVLGPALRVVLPEGTLSGAPGVPALTALRGLLGAAFGTAAGLLPLMLTEVLGYGPTAAGVSLTITGPFWAAGSQLQSLSAVQRHTSVAARLRIGLALVAAGLIGPTLVALGVVPAWAGLGLWAVSAVGIGICTPTVSTQVLELSSDADQGRSSAASIMAPAVSQAVAFAVAGSAIAWQAPHLGPGLFAAIMAGCAALALLALSLAGRSGATAGSGLCREGQRGQPT